MVWNLKIFGEVAILDKFTPGGYFVYGNSYA